MRTQAGTAHSNPQTRAERQLRECLSSGTELDATSWKSRDRSVRGSFLKHLLSVPDRGEASPSVLSASGLIVEDAVDLRWLVPESASIARLALRNCIFQERVDATGIRVDSIELRGCDFRDGLSLRNARIAAELDLRGSRFTDRHHDTDTSVGRIVALDLRNARVGGSVRLNLDDSRRCVVSGGVNARGIVVNGDFLTDGASLAGALGDEIDPASGRRKRWPALDLGNAQILGSLSLCATTHHRCEIAGMVRLICARIEREVCADGATLESEDGAALELGNARVGENVFLLPRHGHRFEAKGCVRMILAEIGGNLDAGGARIDGHTDEALTLTSAHVRGNVLLWPEALQPGVPGSHTRFQAKGLVNLSGSTIDGGVAVLGAELHEHPAQPDVRADALDLSDMVIGGGVEIGPRHGYTCDVRGTVRMVGSTITGDVNLRGCTLHADSDVALTLDRSRIGGRVLMGWYRKEEDTHSDHIHSTLQVNHVPARMHQTSGDSGSQPFRCHGPVTIRQASMKGLHVEGELTSILPPANAVEPSVQTILSVTDSEVTGALVVRLTAPVCGTIDLQRVSARTLNIRNASDWGMRPRRKGTQPASGVQLLLDGLTYERVEILHERKPWLKVSRHSGLDPAVKWLERQFTNGRCTKNSFRPQPYEQMAKVLRAMGHALEADAVAIEKRRLKMLHADRWLTRPASWLYGSMFGFGYSSIRALFYTALLVAAGGMGATVLINHEGLIPAHERSAHDLCESEPYLVALDTFVPGFDLGSKSSCSISGERGFAHPRIAELLKALYSIAGWIVIPLVGLTFSGVLRKD